MISSVKYFNMVFKDSTKYSKQIKQMTLSFPLDFMPLNTEWRHCQGQIPSSSGDAVTENQCLSAE